MPWYIVETVPAGKTGPISRFAEFFPDDAAFEKATNITAGFTSYPTRAAAQAAIDQFNKNNPGSTGPGSNLNSPAPPQIGTTPGVGLPGVSNPLDFLRNIAAFFDKLGQANTWLRIGEFILGAGLIVVGVARLASGTSVGKAAMKVGKAAAIL